jgi:hypothetical protein
MNIQPASSSGEPFRQSDWLDDGIFVVYPDHDVVLTPETDQSMPFELDVRDILAGDWYTRDDEYEPLPQMNPAKETYR